MNPVSRIDRRSFIGAGGGLALLGLTAARGASLPGPTAPADVPASSPVPFDYPAQDRDSVREVVGASHTRRERVEELVKARPALARASWDWGFGDWESALGAASHMGRRDIAAVLLEHGARPDVFTFALLGRVAIVRAIVEGTPGVERVPGPHGITLLQHARNSLRVNDDESARAMVDYLESVDGADERATSLEVSQADRERYIGRYRFGPGDEDYFEVLLDRRERLSLRRGERVTRTLHRVESDGFAPSGVPEVRIRFEVVEGRATALTVHDPAPVLRVARE